MTEDPTDCERMVVHGRTPTGAEVVLISELYYHDSYTHPTISCRRDGDPSSRMLIPQPAVGPVIEALRDVIRQVRSEPPQARHGHEFVFRTSAGTPVILTIAAARDGRCTLRRHDMPGPVYLAAAQAAAIVTMFHELRRRALAGAVWSC